MNEYREEKSCMTCKFGRLGVDEPYPCRKCVRVPTEWKPIGHKAEQTEPQIFICPIQDDYEALIEDEPQTERRE